MCHLAVSQSTRALSVLSRSHEAPYEIEPKRFKSRWCWPTCSQSYWICLRSPISSSLRLAQDPLLLKFLAMSAEKELMLETAAEYLLLHPQASKKTELLGCAQGPSMQIPLLAARHGYPAALAQLKSRFRS